MRYLYVKCATRRNSCKILQCRSYFRFSELFGRQWFLSLIHRVPGPVVNIYVHRQLSTKQIQHRSLLDQSHNIETGLSFSAIIASTDKAAVLLSISKWNALGIKDKIDSVRRFFAGVKTITLLVADMESGIRLNRFSCSSNSPLAQNRIRFRSSSTCLKFGFRTLLNI